MDVPLALNNIGVRKGLERLKQSPQRSSFGRTLRTL